MRILALVANENTYQPYVYENLLKHTDSEFMGIVLVPFITKQKSKFEMLCFLFNLYDVTGFIKKSFQVMKNKFLDIIDLIIPLKYCYSLKSVAKKYHIPLYKTKNINSKESIELIKKLNPDLIISSQGHFVGKKLRNIPKYGVINKHAGLLPKYRGIYPVFWAMLNDEKEIGVTIHLINEKIDDGDIIVQEKISIEPVDTFESLYKKVVKKTRKLFLKAIDLIKDGNHVLLPNNIRKATFFSYPDKDDIIKFRKTGKMII